MAMAGREETVFKALNPLLKSQHAEILNRYCNKCRSNEGWVKVDLHRVTDEKTTVRIHVRL